MAKQRKSTKKFIKNKLSTTLSARKRAKGAAAKYTSKGGRRADPSLHSNEREVEEHHSTSSDDEDDQEDGFDDAGLDLSPFQEDDDDQKDEDEDYQRDELELEELSSDDEREEEGDILSHHDQLEALKEKDPEFYNYLKENDQALLDFKAFGSNADEEGNSTHEDASEDEDMAEASHDERNVSSSSSGPTPVTKAMLKGWLNSVEKTNSIKSIKKMLLAFRAASAIGQTLDEGEKFTYRVDDVSVFNRLVLSCLKNVPLTFNHILYNKDPTAEGAALVKGLPSAQSKWKKVQVMAKSYLTSLLRLLKQITDNSMVRYVLKQSDASVPYFACFPKLGKDYLRRLLMLWESSEEQVRIIAFLCIRKLAMTAPTPYLDMSIKGCYLSLLNFGKSTNAHTWTLLKFMTNCVVELAGLQMATTYEHGFMYIRQLATHLRTALNVKTKESFKGVCNWQYLHSLNTWSQVLSVYCSKELGTEAAPLKPLIYPLVQVAMGALRLKPSAKYFPFRLAIVRLLVDLMNATGTFIPLSSSLLEVFESAEVKSKSKPSTLKPFDFILNVKAPNMYLGTRVYQTGLIEATVDALYEYFAAVAVSISFPELVLPTVGTLKRIMKQASERKHVALNKAVAGLVDKLVQNSTYVERIRGGVDFCPKEVGRVRGWEEGLWATATTASPLLRYTTARRRLAEKRWSEQLEMNAAASASSSMDSEEDDEDRSPGGKESRRVAYEAEDSSGSSSSGGEEDSDDNDQGNDQDNDQEDDEEEDLVEDLVM